MKSHRFYPVIFMLLWNCTFAQSGLWTWINGDSLPNSTGVFGTQGISSPLNQPPAVYEPCEWIDFQGNFWLFGGASSNTDVCSDLWKYDPSINQWTWVKGNGILNDSGDYGVKGIPALSNMPPARGYGTPTWVDLNGDLWLYGGGINGDMKNDLWKYNIATNTWTWMHGSSAINQPAVYGSLGIPGLSNNPGMRQECNVTWVDSYNNLWLFGGSNYGNLNDLWKYDPLINQWAWMKGANFINQPGVYGIKGVSNPANVPGARSAYCHWKDGNGNFWFFGGENTLSGGTFNDLWMYNPLTNEWTWMSGTNILNDYGNLGTQCIPSISNIPSARYENRSFWTDNKGCFWFYGGGYVGGNSELWMFNPITLEWTFVSGNPLWYQNTIYGILGVGSPLNTPGDRFGAVGWFNTINNSLFLFGGIDYSNQRTNDLWRYEIDSNCPQVINAIPIVNFSSTDTLFCEKHCLDFFDLSTNNPTSWQWFFPGSDSLTSALQNPTNICYNNYGTYNVTLIACNAAGCDTLLLTNFIKCYQNPTDSIYQSNDTLFSLPAYTYQWYEVTSGIIAGATNQYFVPLQAGGYYCVITDSVGCMGSSGTIVITGRYDHLVSNVNVKIIPNPFDENVSIEINNYNFKHASLAIKNMTGQLVFQSDIKSVKSNFNFSFLAKGVFVFEITLDENKICKKMMKQ